MHKVKLFKARIAKLDIQRSKLSIRRRALVEQMYAACGHEYVIDSREAHGMSCDNGYGHWWKLPHWECTICGMTDRSYDCELSKLFQKQTGKIAGSR